ncbi:hypothetical protein H0E87_024409 [Populus deltoides]|uniref:Uncharacterized protein n=1 Tax=Populus deltoides TaxID=3696 RepID=A0A8T2X6L7_POPDE|nr:hypothetical protein H0E87_024409 [Populus deltoides]
MRTRRRRTTVTSEVTMAAAGMAWDRVPKVVHVRPKSIESSRFGWINVHTRWNSQSLEDDAAWRAHGLHSWRAEIPDSDYQWLMCDATEKEKLYSQANGELSGICLPRMTISHRPRFVISSSIS